MTPNVTNPLSIADAVRGALLAVEYILDTAIARVAEDALPERSDEIESAVRQLTTEDHSPTIDEIVATSVAAGVTGRKISALASSAGLPQSLIRAKTSGGTVPARAALLHTKPIWRIAGLAAAGSARAVKRAERIDVWLRETHILLDGRVEIEPHSQGTIWTLIHSETAHGNVLSYLQETALHLSQSVTHSSFGPAYLCLEHALRLSVQKSNLKDDDPLATISIAGSKRYGLSKGVPKRKIVPKDFHHIIFPNQGKAAA